MYYLVYGLFYLISLLPMWILYRIADFLAFLLNHVFKYRYPVVLSNLRIAFPEKTEKERIEIARQFYKNFVDNFIEMIKLTSCSKSFIQKRFQFDSNPYEEARLAGQKLQVSLGHIFNWEYATYAVPLISELPCLIVYMPIKNKIFDRYIKTLRSRTGGILLPATDMKAAMIPYRNSQYSLALVADQVPGNVKTAFWLNFFNKPTPFVTGPEAGSKAQNTRVVFAQLYKVKRGFYRIRFVDPPKPLNEMKKGELTRLYVKFLESNLKENPSLYLWSHRRWKHEWKDEYTSRWVDTDPIPTEKK